MKIELLAQTQVNPALSPKAVAGMSDLATLWDGQGSFGENLMEFAGRVCYKSTHRMGTAPNFIPARVKEAHEDVVEHVVVTVHVTDSDAPLRWRMLNRHCEVSELDDGTWIVSGNTRVWLHFFRAGIAMEALPLLRQVAPAVYTEFPEQTDVKHVHLAGQPQPELAAHPALQPAHKSPMRVTLLGFTQPILEDVQVLQDHGSATFFFEGISRACSHQLVRHRLASFSQESQRYVDLSKGNWDAVVPEAVRANPEALQILDQAWESLQDHYAALRQLGIRKEDARFLLPNTAETRIVTTMNFAAWQHFLWLRAVDRAAQWEIRYMGQRVLEALHAIAPPLFQEHWDVYQREFVAKGIS